MRRLWRNIEWEFIAALILALPLLIPFFADGLPNTADSEIHLHRIMSAAVNIDAGYLYPRWTPYLHHGFGYPIHNFYAPGIHLIGAWIYLVTHWDGVFIWKLLQGAAILLYPMGAYLWARTFTGRKGALIAAIAYTYAPFRFDELWLQSNLSQFCAMALLPFLLWRIARAAAFPRHVHVAHIGLWFAAIVLIHHPTGFLVAPFAGLYALVMSVGEAKFRDRLGWLKVSLPALGTTLAGLALGVGLSAIFWLPALAEMQYVQIGSITQGAFNPVGNLIPLDELTRPLLPIDRALENVQRYFTPGQAHLIIAMIGFLATLFLGGRALMRRYDEWLKFHYRAVLNVLIGSVFLLLALFLMLPASAWVWETLPIAKLVVYPWRLLGIAALAVIPGAACLPEFMPRRWQTATTVAVMGIFALAALPLLYTPLSFYKLGELTPGEAFIYEKRTGNMGLTSGNEYLPIWAETRPQGGNPRDWLVAEWRVDAYRETLPADVLVTRITENCARSTTCYTIETPAPFTFWFNQLYYPGWHVTLDGSDIEPRPEGVHGLVALDIPAGTHRITIDYAGTPVQHGSELISAICLLFALALALPFPRHRMLISDTYRDQERARGLAFGVMATVLVFVVINQAYLSPSTDFMRPRSDPNQPPAQVLMHEVFGESLALVGYDLSASEGKAGDTVTLRLYWHLLDTAEVTPRASVQITDRYGVNVMAKALSDRVAGQVFTNWQPGTYATDTYTLTIEPDAVPFLGQIRVAVFTNDPDVVYYPTQSGADFAVLTSFRVMGDLKRANDADLTAHEVIFNEQIALRGTSLVQRDAGQTCLTLRWNALKSDVPDYTVLLHLWDEQAFITAADAPPLADLYPTSQWRAGQTLDDEHCFAVPDGATKIGVGLYEPSNPVPVATSANLPDDALTNNLLWISLP